ncbi:MAG TPA: HDIG domain-containing protein [Clostridiales bacterium]|nr:HDIG domain-containing protein [Clostridiales bacterium]
MFFLKRFAGKITHHFTVRIFHQKWVSNLLLLSIFFIVIFVSMTMTLAPPKYDLSVGQKVTTDIRAPRDIEDKAATAKRLQQAVQSVEPREKIDPTIQIDIKKKIEKFFQHVYRIRSMEDLTKDEKINLLKERNDLNLTDSELLLLATIPNEELKDMESYIYEVITQVMSTGIREEELEKEKNNIANYFMGIKDFSEETKLLAISIVNSSIKANRFLDVETTQQKIEEAKKNVEKVIIKRGTIIAHAGEIITEEKMQLLKDAGMVKKQPRKDFLLYIGIFILTFMIEGLLVVYIYIFHKELLDSNSKKYLILIIFLSAYIISKAIYSISPYMAPVAALSMLIGILIDSKLGIVLHFVMTVLLAFLMDGNDIGFFITAIAGGIIGGLSTRYAFQRTNILFSGLFVSLSNVIVIVGLGLIAQSEVSKIISDGFYGFLNGIFCAVLTIGSLPLWESVFRILTPFKLLELSNPNHPILKRLLMEAPGTYHHSVIVGNLSENAANAIGSNGLLARVSAYYHDQGKLKRPYLFKENQIGAENPHDKMTPGLSAEIIKSHVRDGIEMAMEAKLPQEIIQAIEEHHGTTLVKYFYHKALSEGKDELVKEEDYRYNGRKPQSKETAVIMLADSVEAAVRSMPEPTSDKIDQLIHKIIKDKFDDGQLDECDLTLKDLEKNASSFKTVLMGIFHERIEYPELDFKKEEAAE